MERINQIYKNNTSDWADIKSWKFWIDRSCYQE